MPRRLNQEEIVTLKTLKQKGDVQRPDRRDAGSDRGLCTLPLSAPRRRRSRREPRERRRVRCGRSGRAC